MKKRTLSAGVIALVTYSILYYSGTPIVIQCAAAALCAFCLYELACATDAIKNEALFTLTLLVSALLWRSVLTIRSSSEQLESISHDVGAVSLVAVLVVP